MTVSEIIQTRRSVRGFKPNPIPKEQLEDIFSIARQAPSNCNTQPWHCAVFSGNARNQLEKALLAEIANDTKQTPFFRPGDSGLEGKYKDRQYDCAYRYYDVMGIDREDRARRKDLALKNWQFFGAPHVGVLSMPTNMGEINALDVGIYLQSLMLLFAENGIGSCAQGSLARYPNPIIATGAIPEGNAILCGIAFGYEDTNAKINNVHMLRADLNDTVSFISE